MLASRAETRRFKHELQLDLAGFNQVQLASTGFNWVQLGSAGFNWVEAARPPTSVALMAHMPCISSM